MKTQILQELESVLSPEEFNAFANWADKNDYFVSPASTKFHLSCEGGLAEHSWNVYKALVKFNETMNLGFTFRTMAIVALFHDTCKAGTYVKTTLKSGELSKSYTTDDAFPFGHGEKSAFLMANIGIKMTNEELLAIRYHMGASEGRQVFDIQRKHPLAFWIHTSDMYASMNESKGE